MVDPEGIEQAGSFERGETRVFVEVQCAALDTRTAAVATLIDGDVHIACAGRLRGGAGPTETQAHPFLSGG